LKATVVHVTQEAGGLQYLAGIGPCGFQDCDQILHHLLCLSLDATGNDVHGGRIERDLPEVKTSSPSLVAWTYGPIAAGALSVAITSLAIVISSPIYGAYSLSSSRLRCRM
jgi:hypothetical protein